MPARIILAFALAFAQLGGDAFAGGGDCYTEAVVAASFVISSALTSLPLPAIIILA